MQDSELKKLLEQLDTNDLELLKKKLEQKEHICPFCGTKLDYPVYRDAPWAPCGGDPSWHEEGFAEVKIEK